MGGGVLPGGFFSAGGALFRGEAEPFAGFGEGEGGFEGDVGAEGDSGVVRGVEVDEPLFGFVFAAGSGDAGDGVVEPCVAVVGGVEEGGVGGGYFVDFAAGEFGAEDGFEGEHGLGVGHALVGEGGEAEAEAGGFGDACFRAVGGGVGFGDSGLYLTEVYLALPRSWARRRSQALRPVRVYSRRFFMAACACGRVMPS